jgi:hypothetical protein
MSVKYFTLAEANALLPTLKPLMGQLLERRARVTRTVRQMDDFFEDVRSDIGSSQASLLVRDFGEIERLIAAIQAYGCVIKSIDAGLLDFLTQRNGRDVYLCWRYGEEKIEYFHELHTGFHGRQRY